MMWKFSNGNHLAFIGIYVTLYRFNVLGNASDMVCYIGGRVMYFGYFSTSDRVSLPVIFSMLGYYVLSKTMI